VVGLPPAGLARSSASHEVISAATFPVSVCHRYGVVWISPLGRTYHTRRQPITTDLSGPRPRPEQCPDHAPPVTFDENWPILDRPPPKPDLSPPPARAVDPDEPPPF
jgi:hypothetical protein